MTTKPRARKFRIRADEPLTEGAVALAEPAAVQDDGFGSGPYPTSAAKEATLPPQSVEEQLAAIRAEGLTGRQLRMARRLSQKHGLTVNSDFEAVQMLRARGIDPFQSANMLELVVGQDNKGAKSLLPQTFMAPPVPSTETRPAPAPGETRAREILEIQRDIARRRRRKIALLFARLSVFVFLPTIMAGYYYFVMATPLYATKSEFVIQQADAPAAGGMGGLLSGTSFATSQDSITVQSYLNSRDAMLRLDADIGFKSHFSQDNIDPIQRLEADSSNEDAYKLYQRNVKIGYDPTEGIIKMEVIAADPETSAAFSQALISYAEEQVDNLSLRLREDQMRGASESFFDSERKMEQAQTRVLELQEQLGVLDPASETTAVMSQVGTFELQLAEKQLQLQQLLDNPRPNQARVSGVEGDIERLRTLIDSLRGQLTTSNSGAGSLARISGQLRMAEVDLQTRTMMMQESLQALESSRIEANRQVRYLSLGVSPVAPDEPTHPRAFENTLLAFLIFSGIYLMASLTASILREQVSG